MGWPYSVYSPPLWQRAPESFTAVSQGDGLLLGDIELAAVYDFPGGPDLPMYREYQGVIRYDSFEIDSDDIYSPQIALHGEGKPWMAFDDDFGCLDMTLLLRYYE